MEDRYAEYLRFVQPCPKSPSQPPVAKIILWRFIPPLRMVLELMSAGITPPLSLILAHAPDRNPLTASVLPLYHESLQVAAAPAGSRPFPALSPRIFPQVPGPLPRRSLWCSYSLSSHRTSAFPCPSQGRQPTNSHTTTSVRRCFSELQSFTHVQAPGFARHPGRSHRKAWFPTPRAAVTSTSTPISVRYLPEQWIC